MKSTVTYDYATGDLLETRNTYSYTRFLGREFLSAWQQNRAKVFETQPNTNQSSTNSETNAKTDELLETLYQHFKNDNPNPEAFQLLNRLVQRYEVSKRLHSEYNANWRPVDPKNYHVLERYVRFAEVTDLAYSCKPALPYLNALLKCLDTLTALQSRLSAPQLDRMKQLLEKEQSHVQKLAKQLGVDENGA